MITLFATRRLTPPDAHRGRGEGAAAGACSRHGYADAPGRRASRRSAHNFRPTRSAHRERRSSGPAPPRRSFASDGHGTVGDAAKGVRGRGRIEIPPGIGARGRDESAFLRRAGGGGWQGPRGGVAAARRRGGGGGGGGDARRRRRRRRASRRRRRAIGARTRAAAARSAARVSSATGALHRRGRRRWSLLEERQGAHDHGARFVPGSRRRLTPPHAHRRSSTCCAS